jgi:hypothetical protein
VTVPKQSSWKYRSKKGEVGEQEVPERIGAQQLLDYIMSANEEHYDQADTAVSGHAK